jgi:hypothetical protein
MSEGNIYGSVFCFAGLLCMYFFWVKDDRHLFEWKTLGALVLPVLFNLTYNAIEYISIFPIRVLVEICFYVVLCLLLLESWNYFVMLD